MERGGLGLPVPTKNFKNPQEVSTVSGGKFSVLSNIEGDSNSPDEEIAKLDAIIATQIKTEASITKDGQITSDGEIYMVGSHKQHHHHESSLECLGA